MNFYLNTEKLKKLANNRGLSLTTLAEAAGVHRNSLTPYLSKSRSPYSQVVLDLANFLSIPPSELIDSENSDVLFSVANKLKILIEKEKKIFKDIAPAIFLFGSRARINYKKYSDIDIGITCGSFKCPDLDFLKLKEKVDQVFEDLYLSINLVNLDSAPQDFLEEIEEDLTLFVGSEFAAGVFMGAMYGRKENKKDS